MIDQFHFARPLWLAAIVPLALLLVWLYRSRRRTGAWRAVCDAHLIPFVLEQGAAGTRARWIALLGLAGMLAIVSLAGPVWEQLPQPVFRQQSAMVVMLDLSRSMDAADVKPSRLQRARLKLLDLLRARSEGQTALIAYAGDAFVVTPLTDDTETIASMVQSLTTDLMPAQGSRVDRAAELALALLSQAGVQRGVLLLITDGVAPEQVDALAEKVTGAGHRLSVLGVGTADGAPIPGPDGFVKDASGQIVIPRLDDGLLADLAARGGGTYAGLRVDNADVEAILRDASPDALRAESRQTELETDRWREEGPWLLLALLPLAVLAFRRGVLVITVCAGLQHWPGQAAAFSWDELWLNDNQRGEKAMALEDFAGAAQAFTDPQWRAAAHYRAGEYGKALEDLAHADTPDALYNRGNTQARLGDIDAAMDSYRRVLEKQPDHQDAKYNLELLENLRKPDQSPQAGSQSDSQDKSQPQGGQPSAQDGQPQSSGAAPQGGSDGARNPAQDEPGESKESGATPSDTSESTAAGERPTQPAPAAEPKHEAQDAGGDGDARRQASTMEEGRQTEEQQATEQWLRRVPDDPGGLLRRKFLYQYSRRYQQAEREDEPW